jgi:3-demethoxyubiquinol 3-hydroxylase
LKSGPRPGNGAPHANRRPRSRYAGRIRTMSPIDRLIAVADTALRALAGAQHAGRPAPQVPAVEGTLEDPARRLSGALMRVNHVGEVCAQALYQGQALTARDERARATLEQAAREEQDHLAWSADRIRELGGRPSLLNPLWYAGSLAIGAVAGALGDRWNLAFLAETERQVEEHLTGHLDRLPPADERTRAIVEAMRADEAKHRRTAVGLGAAELPSPVRVAMRFASKVMTTVAYRI